MATFRNKLIVGISIGFFSVSLLGIVVIALPLWSVHVRKLHQEAELLLEVESCTATCSHALERQTGSHRSFQLSIGFHAMNINPFEKMRIDDVRYVGHPSMKALQVDSRFISVSSIQSRFAEKGVGRVLPGGERASLDVQVDLEIDPSISWTKGAMLVLTGPWHVEVSGVTIGRVFEIRCATVALEELL